MQDEARHVAFGRLALRDYYAQLTDAERDEREEFVVEACYLMRDRFRGEEVWENLGLDVEECLEAVDERREYLQLFRSLLFSRIVPSVKDIGLWGEKVQKAYADMGVLDMADADLDALMKDDEDIAEQLDRDKQEAAEVERRISEIEQTIAIGADSYLPYVRAGRGRSAPRTSGQIEGARTSGTHADRGRSDPAAGSASREESRTARPRGGSSPPRSGHGRRPASGR